MANTEVLLPAPVSPRHSTLELAKHDATAGAPERDNAITAPEYNRDPDALQTAPGRAPQTFYDRNPPEAVEAVKNTDPLTDASLATPPSRRLSPRALVIITAIIVTVVVGSAVGIGVGVGLKEESPAQATAVRQFSPQDVFSTIPLSPLYRSLAEIDDYSFKTSPESYGKLSTLPPQKNGEQISISLLMTNLATITKFRVKVLHLSMYLRTIASPVHKFVKGAWISPQGNDRRYDFASISRFTVAPRSRHLSVSVLPGGEPLLNMFLIYESISDEITLLNGSLSIPPPQIIGPILAQDLPSSWTWEHINNKLQAPPQVRGLQFGAPFASSSVDSHTISSIFFAGKHENGSFSDQGLFTAIFENDSGDAVFNTVNIGASFNLDIIPNSDILLYEIDSTTTQFYGYWVNQGKLTSLPGSPPLPTMPSSPFPFSRLAGMSPANSTSLFVYHQLNASTFIEDEWDSSVGGWTPRHIRISMA